MIKIFNIVQKNYRILTREKGSAWLIAIGPLLLVLLLGLAFSNTKPYDIVLAVHTPGETNLTKEIFIKLDEKRFQVIPFPSVEECIYHVKQGLASVCMDFPPEFTLERSASEGITFYVDYSKANLVWNVVDAIGSKVEEKSEAISASLTTDLLTKLKITEVELEKDVPRMDAVLGESKALRADATELHRTIQGMETKALTSQMQQLGESGTNLGENAIAAIDQGKKLITNFEALVAKLDLSPEEKQGMQDMLQQAKLALLGIEQDIGNQGEGAGKSVLDFSLSLAKIQSAVETLATKRDTAEQNAESVDVGAQQIMKEVNAVKLSLSSLQANLGTFSMRDAAKIAQPIKTEIQPITKDTHFNYLFPTLIVTIIMITGILLGATIVTVEKQSRAAFRNYLTPTDNAIFIAGTYLTALLVIFVQLAVFLLIASILFRTNVFGSPITLFVLFLCLATFFIFAGAFVGSVLKHQETAILAGVALFSIFIFFSNAILPINSMPRFMQFVAGLNPFVMGESMLRRVLFFELPLEALTVQFLMLMVYIVIVLSCTVILQYVLRKKAMHDLPKGKNRGEAARQKITQFAKQQLPALQEKPVVKRITAFGKRFRKQPQQPEQPVSREERQQFTQEQEQLKKDLEEFWK